MNVDLRGQVALVTGASRGIGRFLALRMAERGAALALTARAMDTPSSQGETLGGTAETIEASGGRVLAVACEITDAVQAKALVERTVAELGRIDILLNNAGVYPEGRAREFQPEAWFATMDVNVNAVYYLCHYTLPFMMEQGRGKIINVSSSLAQRAYANRLAYCVSKAAVDRLSLNLAEEVREYGIAVNSWAPGLTATDLTKGRGVPVEDVEESFMWLLAQEATYTGQVVHRSGFGKTWGPGVRTD